MSNKIKSKLWHDELWNRCVFPHCLKRLPSSLRYFFVCAEFAESCPHVMLFSSWLSPVCFSDWLIRPEVLLRQILCLNTLSSIYLEQLSSAVRLSDVCIMSACFLFTLCTSCHRRGSFFYCLFLIFIYSVPQRTWRTSQSCSTMPKRPSYTPQAPSTVQRKKTWE